MECVYTLGMEGSVQRDRSLCIKDVTENLSDWNMKVD